MCIFVMCRIKKISHKVTAKFMYFTLFESQLKHRLALWSCMVNGNVKRAAKTSNKMAWETQNVKKGIENY